MDFRFIKTLLAALATMAASIFSPTMADTIDFSDATIGTVSSPFVDQGLTFTSGGGARGVLQVISGNGFNSLTLGTNILEVSGLDGIIITSPSGSFIATQLSIAELPGPQLLRPSISIVYSAGTTYSGPLSFLSPTFQPIIFPQYTSQQINSIEITSSDGMFGITDVVHNTNTVPLPGALALMLSGLPLIGWVARRKQPPAAANV